eukprot:TRINITY_DN2985_c0_g1_i7.p1 TRINITY_DN2985_c0_g1~~TRINITY_DN2985_c0_g1_i7.p1  ORF type:complete len:552 (+),score=88.88 TRINITY_DN2985_c0_g1_i7:55-1710(+)
MGQLFMSRHYVAGLLFVLASLVISIYAADESHYTVYFNPTDGQYSVEAKLDPINGVAWATWADEVQSTGWGRLQIDTNPVYKDQVIAYGAGFLEGVVTQGYIAKEWSNTYVNQFGGKPVPSALMNFFQQNLEWTQKQVQANRASTYWQQADLVMQQLYGLTAGYNSTSPSSRMSVIDFMILNSAGDLETIQGKFANHTSAVRMSGLGTHCSSFIKVTPDLSELYAGHTTWSVYWTMLRIFKSYTLRYRAASTNGVTTLFSSYPGVLSSVDDFYQIHPTELVVLETTNGIVANNALYNKVTPNSLLSWVRVVLANRVATSAKNWVAVFSDYNSGTYNNQWIVVDYRLFTPGAPLPDNLLWIAEQIPGYIHSGDVTAFLRNGYWPSYNIPFFQDIYNISGFPIAVQTIGDWLTYDLHPRAQIFRRDANKVSSLEEYQALLRYNDWQNDPIADGSPGNQISSRFDLVPKDQHVTNPYLVRAAFGATDSKATSYALLRQRRVHAQSGPTHDQQKPFSWTGPDGWDTAAQHLGQPDTFDFPWINMPLGGTASTDAL